MVRAIPHALRETRAPTGTIVCVDISEPTYVIDAVRVDEVWILTEDAPADPASIIMMSGDTAWRMLTRNLPREEIAKRARVHLDAELADVVFDSFALVA
jgi:hypothetical protein